MLRQVGFETETDNDLSINFQSSLKSSDCKSKISNSKKRKKKEKKPPSPTHQFHVSKFGKDFKSPFIG